MDCNYFPKAVFVFEILIYTVFQNSQAIEVEKGITTETTNVTFLLRGDYYQDAGCGIHQLNHSLRLNIQRPNFQKKYNSSSQEYTWEFYATEDCNPSITCTTFHLLESPSCGREFLELSDASGGIAKFCGTNAPNVASSSPILIAIFKTEVHDINTGFHCNVACAQSVCSAANRIVGGHPTTIEQHPYQVSLQSFGYHICGGSIISADRVVTAAHCTGGQDASGLSVRIKSTYKGKGNDVIKVASICQHPGYNPTVLDKDVSVLRLSSTITFDDKAQPVCLPPIGSSSKIAVGTLGTVSGWGTTNNGESSPSQLQKVEVPRVSQHKCKKAYGASEITDTMICFGYEKGGKDSCQGDSGGPLVIKGRGGRALVGIISWGERCAQPGKPGVYTDVAVAAIHNDIMSC